MLKRSELHEVGNFLFLDAFFVNVSTLAIKYLLKLTIFKMIC